ncbi:MAG: UDP-3-O-(3-hydroxymyristoyl)glucosamine N-acyltransferase [Halobacteriovoraceae bacterium]|nr:UDP-3-O-(3-hydroxymyristoyl)glucosamine N-acyltransferase [Halobacteriovoraceae bacterium]
MHISEISHYESSFNLIKNQRSDDFRIEGICDRHGFSSHHIYFCASKPFWTHLRDGAQKGKIKDTFIIFDIKFLKLVESEFDEVMTDVAGWGSVESVPLAMSNLSKPFYDDIRATFNDEIDGRKMGTVKIDPTAKIADNVFIGADVAIGAHVVIHSGVRILSQSSIDENSEIYPNVTLMPKTKIGKECRIHSGTVIGSDGFGYNFDAGIHKKVWHMGGVVVGDQVEMGSNTCIDQGTFSPTVIGDGSKLDNQVQVGHNVHLGKGVILCGQVAIAGSTIIEDYCVFGGQAGAAPDIRIGAGSQVAGGAGVTGSLEAGSTVGGHPARPVKEWLRTQATLRKLSLKK